MSDRVKNPAIDHVMEAAASQSVAAFRKIAEAVSTVAPDLSPEDTETAVLGEVAYLFMQAVPQQLCMAAAPEQIMFRMGEGLGNILRQQGPGLSRHLIRVLLTGMEDGLSHEPADLESSH